MYTTARSIIACNTRALPKELEYEINPLMNKKTKYGSPEFGSFPESNAATANYNSPLAKHLFH